MTIQSIYELFVFDDEEFVTAAYRNLLGREPDAHGLAYYAGRLSVGFGKESIIAQIAKSPECINHHDIKDLNLLINGERRARHRFFRLFTCYDRAQKFTQSKLNIFARIRQQINSLQDGIFTQSQQTNEFTQQMIAMNQANQLLNQRIVELTQKLVTHCTQCQPDATPLISDEAVRQCFVEILGIEPDSEETIRHFARLPSRGALKEKLINSEEFRQKYSALPEYAGQIFQLQIQMKKQNMEYDSCV